MNGIKYHITTLLLALCWLVCITACSSSKGSSVEEETNDETPTPAIKDDDAGTIVELAAAVRKPFAYLISANGKIQSISDQVITAGNEGQLVFSKVWPGSLFTKGEVIARIETTPIDLRLERARLNLYNAEKEYESQLLGYRSLLTGVDSSQAGAIRKKLRISSGMSGLEQDIKEANYDLTRATIRAPFSCRAADVKVQAGTWVKAGQEMFRLYDPGNLLLEIKVLEADIALLKLNMLASITPVADSTKRYKALVHDINPYVDENGMVLVRLRLAEKNTLFPGMNCTSLISIPAGMAVVVPKEAVVMRSGKTVVFSYENGLAKWHYVIAGRDNGREVELKEGIKSGEKVIVSNNLQLAHDAVVRERSLKDTLDAQPSLDF